MILWSFFAKFTAKTSLIVKSPMTRKEDCKRTLLLYQMIGHNLTLFLSFFQSGDISVFETNIRYVGGLLSAFALTGDDLFREKALHVAEKLTPAFKTPTGIPYALVNMRTGVRFSH